MKASVAAFPFETKQVHKMNGQTNGHSEANGHPDGHLNGDKDPETHADLAAFGDPISNRPPATKEEYDEAISAIKSKLPQMGPLKALVELDLTSGHPHVFLDAREAAPTLLDNASDKPTCRLRIRPETVVRLVEGQMESRYAEHFMHMQASGENTSLSIKIADLLSPTQPASPSAPKGRLPEPTTDIKQVRRDVKEFGYGFIKDALEGEQLAALQKRLKEQATGEEKAGVGFFDGGPKKPNQRVWNLPNKGQEFLDLLELPLIDEIVPDFLGDGYIISSYSANISRPGSAPMIMHHDQITINPPVPNTPLGLNLMFFLGDVTEENGGTRVMPGSHKGLIAPGNLADITGTVAAKGPAGTCMVFESRLWHATGPNTSSGGERPVILLFYVRHFIRPQENFFLSIDPAVQKNMSDTAKAVCGYRVTATLGGVEGFTPDGVLVERPQNPIVALNAEGVAY